MVLNVVLVSFIHEATSADLCGGPRLVVFACVGLNALGRSILLVVACMLACYSYNTVNIY